MKPSQSWRSHPEVLKRTVKILHVHEQQENKPRLDGSRSQEVRKGRLIGTIAILLGYGEICHVGVSTVSPNEKNATKKAGRIIATNRARLEFARVYGLADRRPALQDQDSGEGSAFTTPLGSMGHYFQQMGLEPTDVSEYARLKQEIQVLEALIPDALQIEKDVKDLELQVDQLKMDTDLLRLITESEKEPKSATNGVDQHAG